VHISEQPSSKEFVRHSHVSYYLPDIKFLLAFHLNFDVHVYVFDHCSAKVD
jgi:hypothetical protein